MNKKVSTKKVSTHAEMKREELPSLAADIRLWGDIDNETVSSFLEQLDQALQKDGPIILELGTVGGEADAARRIAHEIRICSENLKREIYFLGKTSVYSAGIVILSAFKKERRFLTKETMIMIHERRMDKEVKFSGALSNCIHTARELISQFETGQKIEKEDFKALAIGSTLTADDIMKRAMSNWYISAKECKELGLVEGII